MTAEPLQLDFLAPPAPRLVCREGCEFARPEPVSVDERVIDRALHFVRGQAVLKALLAGAPWGEAFGLGGSTEPVMWQGDGKGITIDWATENARLIKPAQIIARAKQYVPAPKLKAKKEPKPKDPNKPF